MSQKLEEIQKQVTNSLSEAATSYYEQALSIYLTHKEKRNFDYPQVAIGNFCVSIELTAKALITLKCFPLIFPKDKANKYFQLLHYPTIVPSDEVKALIEEIHFSKSETIDYQETMSALKKIYPKETAPISAYFQTTREIRNSSLHSYVYKTSKRALFKVAFVSISLMKVLDSVLGRDSLAKYDTEDIITNFEHSEVEAAHAAIEEAKNRAKGLSEEDECEIESYDFESFYEISIKCPICKQCAQIYGKIDEDWAQSYHDEPPELNNITFIPESFECSSCKLKLSGEKQLGEISVNESFDLSDRIEDYLEHLSQLYYEKYEFDDER